MKRNGEERKKHRIINKIMVICCFLIIILGIVFLVNQKDSGLKNIVDAFVRSSNLENITSDRIKKFSDDNKDKGEIYAICVNEKSQSYLNATNSDEINKLSTEIFTKNITKSEFENNNDLKSYIKDYKTQWLTDYTGREYLIIYKESKSQMSNLGIVMILIGLAGLIRICLIYKRINNKKIKQLTGIEALDNIKTRIQQCQNIVNDKLKIDINELSYMIDDSLKNINSNDNKLHAKIDDLKKRYKEFENDINTIDSTIKVLNDDLNKILLNKKSNNNNKIEFYEITKKVTSLESCCDDAKGKIYKARLESRNLRDEALTKSNNRIIDTIIGGVSAIRQDIRNTQATLQTSIENNTKNFENITSEIKGINSKLDTMNSEEQIKSLKYIISQIGEFKNKITINTSELNNLLDNIKRNNITDNCKNEYENLKKEFDDISYIVKQTLSLQTEANEILRKEPGTREIIKTIKQESNLIKITLEEILKSIQESIKDIQAKLQLSIEKNKEKFKNITSEFKDINFKLDSMNLENQTSYLNNIMLRIESCKDENMNNTLEICDLIENIKSDEAINSLKGEYENLIKEINNASDIVEKMLNLQSEANEILKETPEMVEIISNNSKMRENIFNYVRRATEYIDITIFSITEKDLISLLIDKSKKVKIQIIMDENNYYNVKNGKVNNRSSGKFRNSGKVITNEELTEKFNQLVSQYNVKIRIISGNNHERANMHRKEIVIDGKYSLSGSVNFTYMGLDKNIERLYIFKSKEYALRHKKDFDDLWKQADPK